MYNDWTDFVINISQLSLSSTIFVYPKLNSICRNLTICLPDPKRKYFSLSQQHFGQNIFSKCGYHSLPMSNKRHEYLFFKILQWRFDEHIIHTIWPSLLTLFYCSTEKCIKICSIVKLLYTYLIKYINNKTGYWPLSELCLPNIQQEQPPKGAKGIIFSLSTLNTTIVLTWIGWIDPML